MAAPRPAPSRPPRPARRPRRGRASGDLVVAFVVDPRLWDGGGAARRAWLAATLEATDDAFDGSLTLLHGDPRRVVPELAARVGAGSVHVSRETTPAGRRRDEAVAKALGDSGIEWVETGTPYAVGPGLVRQRLGRAVQGVHAVRQGVAGARLARPGADPARAAAAARPQRRRRHRSGEGRAGGAGPARAAPGGGGGGPAAVAGVPRRRAHGIRRRPQPTRPRRDVTALALPQARCAAPAHAAGRPRGGARQGRAHLRRRAGLAGVLRRRAVAPAAHGVARPAARDVADALRRARGRHRGVAHRAHRLPGRRRRDAPAARAGLDAQPGADDHGELPHQGPARVVAGRGAALPRAPRRRRHRLEQPRLAVGGRHRHRRLALLPGVQPGDPGAEVRPRRRLRAAVGARAGAPGRCRGARAVGGARRLRARLPAADRRPRGGAPRGPRRGSTPPSADRAPTFSPGARTFTFAPHPKWCEGEGSGAHARPPTAGCRPECPRASPPPVGWIHGPFPRLVDTRGVLPKLAAGQYVRPTADPVRRHGAGTGR